MVNEEVKLNNYPEKDPISEEPYDYYESENIKAMSKEDRDWLEAAMKAHTFNDTDRLTELINKLKEWSSNAQPDNENESA